MSEKMFFLKNMAAKVTVAMGEQNCQKKDLRNTYYLTYNTAVGKEGPLIMYNQYRLWDRG